MELPASCGTPFGAATYATLVGLLAVAGLRVGEAIGSIGGILILSRGRSRSE